MKSTLFIVIDRTPLVFGNNTTLLYDSLIEYNNLLHGSSYFNYNLNREK